MLTSPNMRRQPKQSRGQQRIETILDATEKLLCEMDFDKITTNHIAKRANTSVGVMYRYFPNKHAVFAGLVERDLAYLINMQQEILNSCTLETWQTSTIAYIDNLGERYLENPAYIALWNGLRGSESTRQIQSENVQKLADLSIEAGRILHPNLPPQRQQLVRRMVADTINSHLNTALMELSNGREHYDSVMNECKRMVLLYLNDLIQESQKNESNESGQDQVIVELETV